MIELLIGVVLVALFLGFLLGRVGPRAPRMRVEVGQSRDDGLRLQHTMSARIVVVGRRRRVLHFERVDMRQEGWDEQLAEAVARMKQKRAALLAASRIARQ